MKPRGKRVLFQLFFTYLPLLVLLYILVLFLLIRRAATLDDSQTADIIVVLGAAPFKAPVADWRRSGGIRLRTGSKNPATLPRKRAAGADKAVLPFPAVLALDYQFNSL